MGYNLSMDWYLIIKTIHIISSTILFGTGLGIAFFMFRSLFTNNIHEKFYAARNTVLADFLFTLPAVILQPTSGTLLVMLGGYEWTDFWILWTFALYLVAGLCWIPVVFIQIKLKNLVREALENSAPLPVQYNTLLKLWFILGWPAFLSLITIFFLMVFKPI